MRVDAEGYGTFFRTLKCTAICICDFAASGCPNISMPNKNTVWENSWGDGILGRGAGTGTLEKCKDELLGKFILRQNNMRRQEDWACFVFIHVQHVLLVKNLV